jgi:hypothetical protein
MNSGMKKFLSWLVPPYPRSLLVLVPAVVVDAALILSSLTIPLRTASYLRMNFAAHASAERKKNTKLQIWSVEMISIESLISHQKKFSPWCWDRC